MGTYKWKQEEKKWQVSCIFKTSAISLLHWWRLTQNIGSFSLCSQSEGIFHHLRGSLKCRFLGLVQELVSQNPRVKPREFGLLISPWFFFFLIELFELEDNYNIVMVFATHHYESATSIHVSPILDPLPPISSPHPSGLSQSTSFGCPATCMELALVMYFTYGNVHVSMLFSQIILPSSSPTESKSLFVLSVSPSCRIVGTIFLNSIYMH